MIYIYIFNVESLILSSTVCCGVMNRHKKYIKSDILFFSHGGMLVWRDRTR